MILKSLTKFYLLIFLISFVFNNQIRYIKSFTSLINSTDLINYNNSILVSTEGGLYTYDNSNFDLYVDELKYKNIKCITLDTINDKYWLGGNNSKGVIQIIDKNFNFINAIDNVVFDSIEKIEVGEEFSFAIIHENGEYGLAKYSNNSNLSSYVNVYYDFAEEFEIINDILLVGNILYVATDSGLYWIDYYNNFLNDPSSWNSKYNNLNVNHLLYNLNIITASIDNEVYNIAIDNLDQPPMFSINQDHNLISMYLYNFDYFLLTEEQVYRVENSNLENIEILFSMPEDINTIFSDFEIINDDIYLGLMNQGIIITDFYGNYIHKIPNTIFSNNITSLLIDENKDLAGISKTGGFVIKNIFSIGDSYLIKNFYAINKYENNKYPIYLSDEYYGIPLHYIAGGKDPLSILSANNSYYFINSGIFPNPNEYPGFEDDTLGSLIEIDIENMLIENFWGEEIFEGLNGIYNPQWVSGYTVVNQLKILNDDLYVLNPYSEGDINRPIKIFQNMQNWISIEDNQDFNTYIPTEIAFDDLNNIWIAYQSENELYADSDISYSPGGLRVLDINDIDNIDDDIWYNNILPELNGVNVWSIDIGKDIYGNEILWALSDLGVMGYLIDINFSITNLMQIDLNPMNPYYYFSDIPFEEGCRIRIDKQNNAWITTKNNGIKVIQSNGHIWPDNNGINTNNSYLLSNTVNDIVFDDFGYVYVSTSNGISIFETVFSSDNNSSNLAFSPNPFIVNGSNTLTIGNIPSGSTLQIMNLSGKVVKSFKLVNENTIFNWDGRDDLGNYLKTGVYLVSSYHPNKKSLVSKLAIVRE